MIAAQPVPKEIRRPTTMLGRAAGKITLQKSDAWSVQPSTCPACTSTGSMRFTPAMVESRVGNSVATQTTNTLPASPMPNQRMASGIQASGEIGRKISTNGSTMRSTRRDHPMASPSGIAIAPVMVHAENTRARLVPVCRKSSPLASKVQNSCAAMTGGGRSEICGLKIAMTSCHTITIPTTAVASGSARERNTLLARLGQRLLGEGCVELRVVVGLQDLRVLQEPGVGIDRRFLWDDVTAVDRDALRERVIDDVLGEADLLRPHPGRGLRILQDEVDRPDVGAHQVLHHLGPPGKEVVMHILAVADVVALHDRHDLLGLDEHFGVTGRERVGDVRIPGDAGIDRLALQQRRNLRAIGLEQRDIGFLEA